MMANSLPHDGPAATTPSAEFDFSQYRPEAATPEFAQFTQGLRQLQDVLRSAHPEAGVWAAAAAQLSELSTTLAQHRAPEAHAPAGRAADLPGFGNPLIPAFSIYTSSADGVVLHGQFGRFYHGAHDVVFGGALPLLFDWHFALVVDAAGLPISRTAYLNVDYTGYVLTDTSLRATARIDSVEGRKTFLSAELTRPDGTTLARATALMIALQPHQR
jgi:acyl-coenzyme A thioesterase PaaI-like protein